MSNGLDIFAPQISRVVKGLEGKVILVYGSNNLGKTLQGTKMKKPLVLPFEAGLNAIAGVPYMPINSWSDFKKVNKQLTNPKTLEEVKEKYQTIIFDEIEASAKYCQEFICVKHNADSIKEGNGGYGLWKEYETEYWREINRLTGAGFTVYFIAHVERDKDTNQIRPKGDKRALAPIIDLTDITVYLHSQGVDEKGKVVKSKAFLAETPSFFARSRFDYIDTSIEEYTAENLEKAIITAIERQEKAEGIKTATFEEVKAMNNTDLDYDEIMEEVKKEYVRISGLEKLEEYVKVVEENLGRNKKVSEATKEQVGILDLILSELKEIK